MLRSNEGYCHCCRSETEFQVRGEWLRDMYICSNCSSIPRQRHLMRVLDKYVARWEDMSLHESSPSHDYLSRYSRSYSKSFYFEDVETGNVAPNGELCQDLQAMTFDDAAFDIFVTQDVFEHIYDPPTAAREIARVLKPGGIHVFTTPKYDFIQKSFSRIDLSTGKLVHLHAEEYNGSPIGDGRSLVTWTYGIDFENLLAEWSGLNTVTYITRDPGLGLDGEHLEVFVTRKPAQSAC